MPSGDRRDCCTVALTTSLRPPSGLCDIWDDDEVILPAPLIRVRAQNQLVNLGARIVMVGGFILGWSDRHRLLRGVEPPPTSFVLVFHERTVSGVANAWLHNACWQPGFAVWRRVRRF